MKSLELFVGFRYTRAKRRNHFISFISVVSTLGIFLGVTALITVISVMNGFEEELRTRILGMVSHATVYGADGELQDWQQVIKLADEHPRVLGAAPFIEKETLLQSRRVRGALVRGIEPEIETNVSDLEANMVQGSLSDLKPGAYGIVIGVELSWALGAQMGEKITVFAPRLRSTPAGIVPQVRRFTVVGIFEAGLNEYDSQLAIVHLQDAGRLFKSGSGVSGVRLKIDDLFGAWQVANDLAQELPGIYRVRDWTREHANLFQAVRTEKATMFVIMFLIVTVAAFNIVSTLVMAVTDKLPDIAILRTLGMPPGSIMLIFMVQGTLIGVFGTLLGVSAGLALAINVENIIPWLERMFEVDFMDASIYYISEIKGVVRVDDVMRIAAFSFLASFLSTLYPSWKASRIDPAAALRYE